jgi:hypothetical protein
MNSIPGSNDSKYSSKKTRKPDNNTQKQLMKSFTLHEKLVFEKGSITKTINQLKMGKNR